MNEKINKYSVVDDCCMTLLLMIYAGWLLLQPIQDIFIVSIFSTIYLLISVYFLFVKKPWFITKAISVIMIFVSLYMIGYVYVQN